MTTTRPKPPVSKEDRLALLAYFGEGGFSKLQQSRFGHQLEMAARFGQSRRCPVCGGRGRHDGTVTSATKSEQARAKRLLAAAWCLAQSCSHGGRTAGKVPHLAEYRYLRDAKHDLRAAEAYRRKHADAIAAETALEDGPRARAEQRWIAAEFSRLQTDARESSDLWCGECDGSGVVARVLPTTVKALTARPTGSSKHGDGGVDLGDATIERLGRVSVRLGRIRRVDPALVVYLGRYYAPQSGGTQALWILTPAGQALAKAHAKDWSDGPDPDAILSRVVERDRLVPDPRTSAAIHRMREEAQAMADRAHEAWRESASVVGARAPALAPRRERIRPGPRLELVEACRTVREALKAVVGGGG